MNFKQIIIALIITSSALISCDKKNNPGGSNTSASVKTVSNLHAPQETDYNVNPPVASGPFVKFDFETGATTTSNTSWDIAFRGTNILVNGGSISGISEEPSRTGSASAYTTTANFDEYATADISLLLQDAASGLAISANGGWYSYNPNTHVISATPGKIIIVKTTDGRYAKMEILSYYKNMFVTTDINDSRYYTFKYVLSSQGSTKF